MGERKIQYYENSKQPKQMEYVKSHTHCLLCNTALELQHVVEREANSIHETAFCPECEIKTRTKIFQLQ